MPDEHRDDLPGRLAIIANGQVIAVTDWNAPFTLAEFEEIASITADDAVAGDTQSVSALGGTGTGQGSLHLSVWRKTATRNRSTQSPMPGSVLSRLPATLSRRIPSVSIQAATSAGWVRPSITR
jgi:hypothetical protein